MLWVAIYVNLDEQQPQHNLLSSKYYLQDSVSYGIKLLVWLGLDILPYLLQIRIHFIPPVIRISI